MVIFSRVSRHFVLILAFAYGSALSAADGLEAKIEAYVNNLAASSDFSGTVLVTRANEVLFEKAYGLANRELGTPNTLQTKFEIGSVSKQFTALTLLKLAEDGRAKVGDKVCLYLQRCPVQWEKVTLHHLLTHTSGIPDFVDRTTGQLNYPEIDVATTRYVDLESLVTIFETKALGANPGEKFSYSNPGYVILAYIIEKVAGKPFEQAVSELILARAGLSDTGFVNLFAVLPGRASGYDRQDGQLINRAYLNHSLFRGAGTMYSTVRDLQKWEQALRGGQVVSQETWRQVTTPALNGYGYGMVMDKISDHNAIWHDGNVWGFSSDFTWFPDDDLSIIVLSNFQALGRHDVSRKIAGIVFE